MTQEKLTSGQAIAEAKRIQADGVCRVLPCGLEAVRFPQSAFHAESVNVHDGHDAIRSVRMPGLKHGWGMQGRIAWSGVESDPRFKGRAL